MFTHLFGSKEATPKSTQPTHTNTVLPLIGSEPIPDDTPLDHVRLAMLHLMGQDVDGSRDPLKFDGRIEKLLREAPSCSCVRPPERALAAS